MAVITKITTQQKNKDRYNIFMDYGKGEEYAFSVDSAVLIRFELRKGMEIDEFSILEIQFQDDIRKAYNRAINYLARRMRSEKEIRDYLLEKEIEQPIINEVIHKLAAQKYINDEEYALSYVRTQMNTTDKGPDLIRMELRERGINEGIIKHAIAEYPFENQVEKAIKVAEKVIKKNSKESQRIVKQKAEQFLLRKGYSFDVILLALTEADTDKELDDEMEAIRYQGEKTHRKYSKFTGFEYTQKMKQALFRKGFSMDLIEKYLEEAEKS
ncbi:recombination regulator RecX [Neobacillus niacini]|uniref:recombination regulator RecX n=1 Tax=Neobacillus niacini TaxID=86668 RepID=UPI001C8E7A13|nr:recombination regulator RecX [Neobacillus niacini]MBY0148679.1 recombination regulator RecX [Neobacillus niacini]